MPRFRYEARDKQGRQVAGEVEARSRVEASLRLREADLWITKLVPAEVARTRQAPSAVRRAAGQWRYSLWPVRAAALRDFFLQLADLLQAGINVYEAMTGLADRVHWRLRRVVREIAPPLARGEGLGDQLARYPYVFAATTVGMMRAGERSGQLPEMCRLLADQYQQDHRIWLSLLPVRLYGWLVIFFAIMAPAVPAVLPAVFAWRMEHSEAKMAEVLAQLWQHYAVLLVHRLLPLFLGVVLLDWLVRWLLRQPWAAGLRQNLLRFLPGAAGYLQIGRNARVLAVLEAMVHAGASYGEALEVAAEAAGPGGLGRQLARAAQRVQAGEPLGTAMAQVTRLPFAARSAILTAEQAGAQERTLGRLAAAEREALEAAPRRLALLGNLGGLGLLGLLTALAVAWGYYNYWSAVFEAGEKLMQ